MNAPLDIHANVMPTRPAHLTENQSSAHLTDDQIDDHLIGDLAADPAAHLAVCTACFDRVAAAADPLASFSATTLAWSERHSATLPIPVVSPQQPLWQQRVLFATACFAVAVGISLTSASLRIATNVQTAELQPQQQTTTQQAARPTPALTPTASIQTASAAVPPRPQQLAADNQMLKAIGNAMDTGDDSAADLGLTPVSAHPNRPATPTSLQD